MLHRTITLACVAAGSLGCFAFPEKAEIRDFRALDLAGVRKVVVDTSNGSVRVLSGAGEDEGELRTTRFARGMTEEEARTAAASIAVGVERDPDHSSILRVTASFPGGSFRPLGASFEVRIPPGPDLELRTRNGRIEVVDADGDVLAKTSNGAVVLRGVRGDVDVHTSNGTIEAEETEGDLVLQTSNGSVRARAARLRSSPRVVATTSNGSVRLELPEDLSARLSLRTSNGSISAGFGSARVAFVERRKTRIDAEVNDAAGEIEVVASNGSVVLHLGLPPGP